MLVASGMMSFISKTSKLSMCIHPISLAILYLLISLVPFWSSPCHVPQHHTALCT